MQQCPSDCITYLPLPDFLYDAIENSINVTAGNVASYSGQYATNFNLPENNSVKLVVEEAKKAYQLEKGQTEITVLSLHGAVFKGSWRSGALNDTIIVPLVKDYTEVFARDEVGRQKKLDWHWKNAIFVSKLTIFEIHGGKKVGAVIIQFKR
ncbi:hypothetical protein LOZ58_006830 [Ophidiomyces ophidiicola]|nr:hypothetical protein LOZ65_006866 [Ophidiomyces ophidiicola]KAI1955165.1 hypothetical protein LOZ58_006830 [Ophidiomyces ophidiicola]